MSPSRCLATSNRARVGSPPQEPVEVFDPGTHPLRVNTEDRCLSPIVVRQVATERSQRSLRRLQLHADGRGVEAAREDTHQVSHLRFQPEHLGFETTDAGIARADGRIKLFIHGPGDRVNDCWRRRSPQPTDERLLQEVARVPGAVSAHGRAFVFRKAADVEGVGVHRTALAPPRGLAVVVQLLRRSPA
jgi:hypothetical protein